MDESKSFEKVPQPETEIRRESSLPAVEILYREALEREEFERVAESLGEVEALQRWREKTSGHPFGSFHELIEGITILNKLSLRKEDKEEQIRSLTDKLEQRVASFSPRVADLFLGMLSQLRREEYKQRFEEVSQFLDDLQKEDDLDVLYSPHYSWNLKFNRLERRLLSVLPSFRGLDRREGKEMSDDLRKWRKEQLKKAPDKPPDDTDRSKPGVDPMERLEKGEKAPSLWSIYPAWGGYYKEKSFSKWDSSSNEWVDEYGYRDVKPIPLSGNTDHNKGPIDITMTARVDTGRRKRLPVPYTHGFSKVETGGRNVSVLEDQNGDIAILVEGEGEVEIKVVLAPHSEKRFKNAPEDVKVPEMPSEFSEETESTLQRIKTGKQGNIERGKAIANYVRRRIKYLAPKDKTESNYYNSFYNNHSKGFAGAVDEIREADCDVANTYFATLCTKLNIPVRHVVGHSIKGKDKEGRSNIHTGTGHAWSEVWDEVRKEWNRIDATPPGDPNLENEEELDDQSTTPGDYGKEEGEATSPSDEQIEELRKKLAEHKEKLSYTKEERELAERAGVELREARQIVKEINEAEKTRLPNGELVIDALSKLFNAIVESRKSKGLAYEGPLRKREGGERIENIIRHKIGITSGENDPLSREKITEEEKEEKIIGGFDLYIIGDKSGSMGMTVNEEELWKMQRRAEYLIFSSLHCFGKETERAGLKRENALSVRTQGISFRGNGPNDIDEDKPLSSKFTAKDKVRLWHSLTEQGMGNGDVQALSYIYEQIKNEVEENERKGIKDNHLRLVIACSDGGYVGDNASKMRDLAGMLKELGVIVVGMGLTETAKNVKIVMDNPPHSRGDVVEDINKLPAVVARHVVLKAVELFPEKARENAKQIIESSIKKFNFD